MKSLFQSTLDYEKRWYQNDLVPFKQYIAQLKAKNHAALVNLYERLQQSHQIIKKRFALQEANGEYSNPEESYALFEEASKKWQTRLAQNEKMKASIVNFEAPIQENLKLPWSFMDRVYQLANQLLNEGSIEDAEKVFLLLRALNPLVFEYLFGHAFCQQSLGYFEEAAASYLLSIALQPKNPAIFFQIASCFYELKEYEPCCDMLNYVLERTEGKEEYKELAHTAMKIKKSVEVEHGLKKA